MVNAEKMDIIREVEKRLEEEVKKGDLITGQVRDISAEVFKHVENREIGNILGLCEQLLESRRWEMGVVAYDWAFRVRKQYREDTFFIFEKWLKKYITGWGDCDDFCTHAFGEVLSRYPGYFKNVLQWTVDPNFCVRRAAAVILIYPIRKGKLQGMEPYTIVGRLMQDSHHLVLKGYGWMLKVLSSAEPQEVFHYLMKNKEVMPRVSLRYAVEKFDKDRREAIMKK